MSNDARIIEEADWLNLVEVSNDARIRGAAACLNLDEAELTALVSQAKRAVAAFCWLEPRYKRHCALRLEVRKTINSHIAEISLMQERMLVLFRPEILYYRQAIYGGGPEPSQIDLSLLPADRKRDEIACKLQECFAEAISFLQAAPESQNVSERRGNAAKLSRDLLWTRLLQIWVSFGGTETGNDAAGFLEAASERDVGGTVTAVPEMRSIVEWLRVRHKRNSK